MKKSKVMTFSLDDASIEDLKRLCKALGLSKSDILRQLLYIASTRLESGNLGIDERGDIWLS